MKKEKKIGDTLNIKKRGACRSIGDRRDQLAYKRTQNRK